MTGESDVRTCFAINFSHFAHSHSLRGGQNCEKWKTFDKWEYYKLYLTCMLKMAYMSFILSILVICNIQKPTLGNDMFCTCFKQWSARSNQIAHTYLIPLCSLCDVSMRHM